MRLQVLWIQLLCAAVHAGEGVDDVTRAMVACVPRVDRLLGMILKGMLAGLHLCICYHQPYLDDICTRVGIYTHSYRLTDTLQVYLHACIYNINISF